MRTVPSRYALSISIATALIGGCGGSQHADRRAGHDAAEGDLKPSRT
jgi:hypothetical protein